VRNDGSKDHVAYLHHKRAALELTSLHRCKTIVPPLQDAFISDQDLQIGGIVPIFARCWELLDADHNTCKYMEAHKEKYPHADFDLVSLA